jgi:hypothetical protein
MEMKTDTCPFPAEERYFKLHEREVKDVARYQATRFDTFLLGFARRGESSFSFKKKKFRFFHCWIKDFSQPENT